MAKNPAYTPEQDEWLRKFIPGRSYKEIVPEFNKQFNENRTVAGLRQHCKTTLRINTGLTCYAHPIGTKLKKDDKTVIIKISPKKWIPYSRYIWEQHHKETLKSDEVIIHLDRDTTNDNIENLYKVTRSVQVGVLRAFNIRSGQPELMRTAIMTQELKQLIKEKE